jgi:hypothetical protein
MCGKAEERDEPDVLERNDSVNTSIARVHIIITILCRMLQQKKNK